MSSRRRRETEPGGRTPGSRAAPAGPERFRAWAGPLAIALAAILVYANSLRAAFHFDDVPNIVRNLGIRDLGALWPPSGGRWVGFLTFALNYRLGGFDVLGYHLVNLAIHVANALLVSALAATTLQTPALRDASTGPLLRRYLPLAAGLLFAVHPLTTQAVTYVVQRFTSLATLFFLLSIVLYARARLALEGDGPWTRAAAPYALSVVAALAAMRTKEIAFTLPAVAAAYDLLLFRASRWRAALVPLAATALLVPLALATEGRGLWEVLAEPGEFAAETREIPRSVYLLTQTRVLVRYLRLLVLPVGQNLDHDVPLSTSIAEPSVLLSVTLLAAVVAGAVALVVRARRAGRAAGVLVGIGVGWFFSTISVESSLVPIRDVMFEHRTYLPVVGAAMALATALLVAVERMGSTAPAAAQVALALLVTVGPLGVATWARNRVWKDDASLWSDAVAKSPGKARPHLSLGYAYGRRGQLEDAIREYRKALAIDPGYADAHNNLGAAYQALGRLDDAMREYREALRLAPALAGAHNNLGSALQLRGDLEGATREHLEALRLDPGASEAHHNLARAYEAAGELAAAERAYAEGLRLDPARADTRSRLEAVRRALGQSPPAPRRDPAAAAAVAGVGAAFLAQGRLDEAAARYREALRLDPASAQAHFALGYVLAAQGRRAEAVEEYRRAAELDPSPEAALNLAVALDDAGRERESVAWYDRFLAQAGDREAERAAQVRARLAQIRAAAGSRKP